MKTLVAGAGLAGLYAGASLSKSGHEVTVFEARDRVGGRVWSEKIATGTIVERGGEFIDPGHHLVRRLCAEMALPLIPSGIAFSRRENTFGETTTVKHVEYMMKALVARAIAAAEEGDHADSLDDVFADVLGPQFRGDPYYRRVAGGLGLDPSLVSAQAFLAVRPGDSPSREYIEHAARVLGGNQRIAKGLANWIAGRIVLNTPVSAVEQDSSGVTFLTEDGSTHRADAAVIAVPLPVLRDLDLAFDLPELVQRSLDNRIMGIAAKLSTALAEGSPPRAVQHPENLWWAWNPVDKAASISVPAVTAFAGGAHTLDSLDVKDGGATWTDALRRLRPDLNFAPDSALADEDSSILTDWSRDAWTRGSYSSAGVGWEPALDEAFAEPVGRVAFAGEHTAGVVRAMEGALASGLRAARSLHHVGRRTSLLPL
jgi:monoamine oxidase